MEQDKNRNDIQANSSKANDNDNRGIKNNEPEIMNR